MQITEASRGSGSSDPDWHSVAKKLRLIPVGCKDGTSMHHHGRVRTAETIAQQHGCLVKELTQVVKQVISTVVEDVEQEAQEGHTASISYWEDAVEYNKRQQKLLLATTDGANLTQTSAGTRIPTDWRIPAAGSNIFARDSQWMQCTGLYTLEHVDKAKHLYAGIAVRAKQQRLGDDIATSVLQDDLDRAATAASALGKAGSTQYILNVISEERKASLAAVQAECDTFDMASLEALSAKLEGELIFENEHPDIFHSGSH